MFSPSHRSTPNKQRPLPTVVSPPNLNITNIDLNNDLTSPLITSDTTRTNHFNSTTNIVNSTQTKETNYLLAIIYGIVNTILTVPCMYGYALIIFSDPFFAPHLPMLCKLVLFSSAVHQIVFSISSTLPFAIGQVQDAVGVLVPLFFQKQLLLCFSNFLYFFLLCFTNN